MKFNWYIQDGDIDAEKQSTVDIILNRNVFIVKMAYNAYWVDKLKSIKKAWWQPESQDWMVPANYESMDRLQEFFNCWDSKKWLIVRDLVAKKQPKPDLYLYPLPGNPKEIGVQLKGYGADVAYLKTIPDRWYDKVFRRWSIPNEEIIITKLLEHYSKKDVKIHNRLPDKAALVSNPSKSLGDRQTLFLERCEDQYVGLIRQTSDTLIQQRYSWSTISSYMTALIKFCQYHKTAEIEQMTEKQINAYLSYLAREKVSASLLNIRCSALKFYYTKVVFRPDIDIAKIKRPKKAFVLPRILSVEEITRMMKSLDNLKHKTLLFLCYSSGLRLAELVNLKLVDILWDRNQIHVRGAKGKKDRMVMLSESVKEVFKHYANEEKPSVWAFEGQNKDRPYSGRSFQQVVHKAASAAKISKRVTPHVLRHCFATHLHDDGTSIKLIQELLGHSNIKTTMIYTHVSTASIKKVQSPLDKLGLDKDEMVKNRYKNDKE